MYLQASKLAANQPAGPQRALEKDQQLAVDHKNDKYHRECPCFGGTLDNQRMDNCSTINTLSTCSTSCCDDIFDTTSCENPSSCTKSSSPSVDADSIDSLNCRGEGGGWWWL